MQEINIPPDISATQFFEEFVPETFREIISENPIPGMEDTYLTLQVRLTGEGGCQYGITVRDAREMEVKEGELENPMLTIVAPYLAWRAAISGQIKGAEMFYNPARFAQMVDREMYETARTTSGTVIFKPVLGEGLDVSIKIIFNGAEQPSVTLSASPEVFYEMTSGTLSGPEAFLQGKLKIEGDLTFAMRLNAFMKLAGQA